VVKAKRRKLATPGILAFHQSFTMVHNVFVSLICEVINRLIIHNIIIILM
jgi:hypothetical protein